MSDLSEYWSGAVLPEQVDNLGHMNVRFYGLNAATAAKALLATIGLTPETLTTTNVDVVDAYTRHYAEQTEGAPLTIQGGICAADADAIRMYLEMTNRDTGVVAATFIQKAVLLDILHRTPLPFSGNVLNAAQTQLVEIPERGMPRSLNLDPVRTDITASELEQRGLATGMDAVIGPELCDEHGFMILDHPFSLHAALGMQMKNITRVPIYDQPGGDRIAGITMESRNVSIETPRAGDWIKSYYGVVHIEGKISQGCRWDANAETGHLVNINTNIDLSFDTTTRRPIDPPENMLASLKKNYHPDLK